MSSDYYRRTMSNGGKGSAARPIPDREKYESNWDSIFKKKKEGDSEAKTEDAVEVNTDEG